MHALIKIQSLPTQWQILRFSVQNVEDVSDSLNIKKKKIEILQKHAFGPFSRKRSNMFTLYT